MWLENDKRWTSVHQIFWFQEINHYFSLCDYFYFLQMRACNDPQLKKKQKQTDEIYTWSAVHTETQNVGWLRT